jgi:hypothetical protein
MHPRGPERRRFARGGRRPEDQSGYTPLIVLIDPDPNRRRISDAILTKMRFAVAPVETLEGAVNVMRGLVPEAIICPAADADGVREAIGMDMIPLVAVSDLTARSDHLIMVVRSALRLQPIRR